MPRKSLSASQIQVVDRSPKAQDAVSEVIPVRLRLIDRERLDRVAGRMRLPRGTIGRLAICEYLDRAEASKAA